MKKCLIIVIAVLSIDHIQYCTVLFTVGSVYKGEVYKAYYHFPVLYD